MVLKIKDIVKPILGTIGIIIVLRMTGLLGAVSDASQSAVMMTGILDASASYREDKEETFDYDFAIRDLKGNRVSMSQFKGRVIFLNLWATWCGPCRAEMPTIQKLYDGVGRDSIQFIILSLDRDKDKEKVIQYVHHKSYTFPVYQPSGSLTEQLNVPVIPTTFIISKEGRIIGKEVGTTNFDTPKFRKFLETAAAR